jgi:hypothetical protein
MLVVTAVKPNAIPAKESVCALKLLMLKSIQNRFDLGDLPIKHLVTFSKESNWMSMKTDCKTFAIRN